MGQPLSRELLGHLKVAVVLASIVLVIEHHGYLNWLASASLRLAAAISPAATEGVPETPSDQPVVLGIGSRVFETTFKQSSPLDRRGIAAILHEIAAGGPALIVVDLDLSPGLNGAPDASAQQALDAALVTLASARGMKFVLGAPLPVLDGELHRQKVVWMRGLCAAGIAFAQTNFALSQGVVLRYAPADPGLGQVAARLWQRPGHAGGGSLCSLLATEDKPVFLSSLALPAQRVLAANFDSQAPLRGEFLQSQSAMPHEAPLRPGDLDPGVLAGRPVFLGALYNPDDSFFTAWGERSGVAVHAAVFTSMLRPLVSVSHWGAFALDLLIGVAAGFLFHWSWTRFNDAERRLAGQARPQWRAYIGARAWLAGNFVLLAMTAFLLFVASGFLLRANAWANPAPILLGVFVKSLIGSRAGLASAAPAWLARADGLVMAPFVLWALYYLLATD